MDLKICGILDIVFILLLLLSLFIGYKKGFLKKAVGMVGLFSGLIVAFVFCTQFAEWLEKTGLIYDDLYAKIHGNVLSSKLFQDNFLNLTDATVSEVLQSIGVPKFFASLFAGHIKESVQIDVLAHNISHFFAHTLMVIISFLILFIGIFLLALVLKIVINLLRGNKIIRVLDGILGMALYACLFLIGIYIIFMIMRLMENVEFYQPVKKFLDVDMMLADSERFRITKYFYEHNILYDLISLLF